MFKTTVWIGSQPNRSSGAGFGINIPIKRRDSIFDKDWKHIELILDDESHVIPITGAFWEKCNEVRSPIIGKWLIKNRVANWTKGRPTKLLMYHLGANKFKVKIKTSHAD